MLLVATKSLLAKVQNKENPPIEVTKSWLRAVIDYLERTTNFPTHDVVLGAIDKLTAQVGRNHEKMKERTTAIRINDCRLLLQFLVLLVLLLVHFLLLQNGRTELVLHGLPFEEKGSEAKDKQIHLNHSPSERQQQKTRASKGGHTGHTAAHQREDRQVRDFGQEPQSLQTTAQRGFRHTNSKQRRGWKGSRQQHMASNSGQERASKSTDTRRNKQGVKVAD